MKLLKYKSEVERIFEQRNGYLVLSCGLLILCLLLALSLSFSSGKEQIVMVTPDMNKDVWISNKSASKEYLSRMTLFLSELALNITSDNVDYQQEMMLRYIDPSYYMKFKPELIAIADKVKKEHITTTFFPVDVRIDNKANEAYVTGDVKSYVGDAALPIKRVTYQIKYRFNSFTPLITLFGEVKNA